MKDDKEKICKVSDAVQQLTLSKPFILETITTKTINYTKMADYLLPEIEKLVDEKPSLPAVNMALRRFAQKYMEGEMDQYLPPEPKTSKETATPENSYQITISNGYCGLSDTPESIARMLQPNCGLTEIYAGTGIDGRTYLFINNEAAVSIKQAAPPSTVIEDSCIRISISTDSNPASTAERFSMKIKENRFHFALMQLTGTEFTVFCRTADLATILG